jgi:hypothetical protein
MGVLLAGEGADAYRSSGVASDQTRSKDSV